MALWVSQIWVEIREIEIKNKPTALRDISPKASVPVLHLPDGTVIDESLDIMRWALKQQDPQHWLPLPTSLSRQESLLTENDSEFKKNLDRYKYPTRYLDVLPTTARSDCEIFLSQLEDLLAAHTFLLSDSRSMADIAIFPFIRQFAGVEPHWFQQTPYRYLQAWLAKMNVDPTFEAVMEKYRPWSPGDPVTLFGIEKAHRL